jgi:tRNA1(Val) A37 N6-methylase TrmN6
VESRDRQGTGRLTRGTTVSPRTGHHPSGETACFRVAVSGYRYRDLVTDDLLTQAEQSRTEALRILDATTQSALGQFFTPARAAALIASMPRLPETGQVRLLDPGAGSGMLSAALVARVLTERPNLSVHVVAVECDHLVVPYLRKTLEACSLAANGRVTFDIIEGDFIMAATGLEADPRLVELDLVIQNPPYAKLAASSAHRIAVLKAGVDAPNLYAAFLALGVAGLKPGGATGGYHSSVFLQWPLLRRIPVLLAQSHHARQSSCI